MLFSFHNNKVVDDESKSNIHFSSMFLLWEMCFIQNHLFNSSRFCAGYVCEAKQTSLLWRSERGCQSVTIRETTANKVTKHVVPAFLYILPPQKRFETLFFSGFQSISPFFTCGMSCIGNLSAIICYCL